MKMISGAVTAGARALLSRINAATGEAMRDAVRQGLSGICNRALLPDEVVAVVGRTSRFEPPVSNSCLTTHAVVTRQRAGTWHQGHPTAQR